MAAPHIFHILSEPGTQFQHDRRVIALRITGERTNHNSTLRSFVIGQKMILIIAGGREYREQSGDREFLDQVASQYGVTSVITGGSRGADAVGEDWAATRGLPVKTFVPSWKQYGRRAGVMRNSEMSLVGDLLVAFPGGRGTVDMIRKARARGLPVICLTARSPRWVNELGVETSNCVVFHRDRNEFGSLSCHAPQYPVRVLGQTFPTVDALFHACQFPDHPEIQETFLSRDGCVLALQSAEQFVRSDWGQCHVDVMRWCLRVKLIQNFGGFFDDLVGSKDRPLVHESTSDRYWGATLESDNRFHGINLLGQLLMELRDELREWLYGEQDDIPFPSVQPPPIANFKILGVQVRPIDGEES